MNFTRTHSLIKRLADLTSCGKIAKWCGTTIQTAESWTRVPESNENPHGTGKKNPIDCVLRLMAKAHEKDPGLSLEISETFVDYHVYLAGDVSQIKGSIHQAVGQSLKEATDVVIFVLNSKNPDWYRAYTEIKQAQAAMEKVLLFVKQEMKEIA